MGQGIDLLGALTRVIPERLAPSHLATPARILIIKLSSIGDVVHALPVASALRRTYPAVRISWAVEDWCASLVQDHPAVDRLIRFPKMVGWSADRRRWFGAFRKAVGELRAESYDVVLDLQGLLKSACLARIANSPLRIARWGQREGAHLVSYGVPLPSGPTHAVDEYLQLARYLGATTRPVEFNLPIGRQAAEAVTRLLENDGVSDRSPLIVISPSPSRRWKAWPIERWAEVADALADRGTIVIAGARGHQRLHAQLVARMQHPAIDLTGRTTLSELVALLQRAALHIAHDSGSVHIAAALGTRVVALYGPTSPSRLAPFGQLDALVYHGDLCGPECPAYCLRRRRCLSAATPDEIVTKARQALAARAAGVPAPSHMTVSAIQPGRVADER